MHVGRQSPHQYIPPEGRVDVNSLDQNFGEMDPGKSLSLSEAHNPQPKNESLALKILETIKDSGQELQNAMPGMPQERVDWNKMRKELHSLSASLPNADEPLPVAAQSVEVEGGKKIEESPLTLSSSSDTSEAPPEATKELLGRMLDDFLDLVPDPQTVHPTVSELIQKILDELLPDVPAPHSTNQEKSELKEAPAKEPNPPLLSRESSFIQSRPTLQRQANFYVKGSSFRNDPKTFLSAVEHAADRGLPKSKPVRKTEIKEEVQADVELVNIEQEKALLAQKEAKTLKHALSLLQSAFEKLKDINTPETNILRKEILQLDKKMGKEHDMDIHDDFKPRKTSVSAAMKPNEPGITQEGIEIPINPRGNPFCQKNIDNLKSIAKFLKRMAYSKIPKAIKFTESGTFELVDAKNLSKEETKHGIEQMIELCNFATENVISDGLPPCLLKPLLDHMKNNPIAKSIISKEPTLRADYKRVSNGCLRAEEKYAARKEQLYIDQIVAPLECPKIETLLNIPATSQESRTIQTMFEGQARVLMAEKGVLSPSQILLTYKDFTTTEKLFVGIESALNNPELPLGQKMEIVKFVISWIESGLYNDDLENPETAENVQKVFKQVIDFELSVNNVSLVAGLVGRGFDFDRNQSMGELASPNQEVNLEESGARAIDEEFFKPIIHGRLFRKEYKAAVENFANNIILYRLPLFQSIPMSERLEGDTRKTNSQGELKTPHARAVVVADDNLSIKIGGDILKANSPSERGRLAGFYFHVAFQLHKKGDFDGANTVLAGLQKPSIERIILSKETKLPSKATIFFEKLKELHSATRNYQNLIEEANKLMRKGITPLMPYVLTLGNVTMADQLPHFVEIDGNEGMWNPARVDKMHKAIHGHLSGLHYMTKASEEKKYDPHQKLDMAAFTVQVMDEAELEDLSDQIRPREEEKQKKSPLSLMRKYTHHSAKI